MKKEQLFREELKSVITELNNGWAINTGRIDKCPKYDNYNNVVGLHIKIDIDLQRWL